MSQKSSKPILFKIIYAFVNRNKKQHKNKKKHLFLDKRQKFAIGVAFSSIILFITAYLFNGYGILTAFFLALLSDIVVFWTIRKDLQGNFLPQVFILPFLYSLSFGLFSFLTPARLLMRTILILLYAIGLYSVFLSENIFTVASIRTIALLNSGRIVSLVTTLVAYFFLANTIFSLRINIIPTAIILFIFSFLFCWHAIWTYTLEKSFKKELPWNIIISLCLTEFGIILWYWATTSTVEALFLTSIWYVFIGLSHVWFDKRLFRNVLWEYAWVSIIGIVLIISLTNW